MPYPQTRFPKARKGYHMHKCPNPECGYIWQHCNEPRNHDKAHQCPKCHTYQWTKWYKDLEQKARHFADICKTTVHAARRSIRECLGKGKSLRDILAMILR